ncbi:uncharacterized protein [Procambarus clarkii]|uniref:uncharacterized protein n=1 Tax=Procambarus clarkii TaxID=6728 RepID=UPI003742AF4C
MYQQSPQSNRVSNRYSAPATRRFNSRSSAPATTTHFNSRYSASTTTTHSNSPYSAPATTTRFNSRYSESTTSFNSHYSAPKTTTRFNSRYSESTTTTSFNSRSSASATTARINSRCSASANTTVSRMPTTSQKHHNFVSEPMGGKGVTKVPGVGQATGRRLSNHGCTQATNLLGEYLVRQGREHSFVDFMQDNASAQPQHAKATYNALKEWSDNNLM